MIELRTSDGSVFFADVLLPDYGRLVAVRDLLLDNLTLAASDGKGGVWVVNLDQVVAARAVS